MTRRTERINEELRAHLAELLQRDITDPRIGFVTLLRVDVSPDLSWADVFWSALEEDAEEASVRDEVQAGLESAASFLRHRLAQRLPLRKVPKLRFHYDPSLDLGDRTLELIREIEDEST